MKMTQEHVIVMCCFCSRELSMKDSVQMEIKITQGNDESQAVYCHKSCLKKVIHSSVPLIL